MGFVKVVKSKAYYKRFQVKMRRRREAKTDYYARKRLLWNDKNKYNAPKFRLVVRFTNRDVIVQLVNQDISGDRVIQSAYGHELKRYGLPSGFNNFPATYATGLLLARKANAHFKLPFLGSKEAVNQYYNVGSEEVECADESGEQTRRPLKAILDVGLRPTTTGCRLFAAVKGACDGGMNVPHTARRFPGAPREKSEETDFEVTRKYIFGGHIADYMRELSENDEERYNAQFSQFIKAGVSADDLEGLFEKIHDAIRAETQESLLAKDRNVKNLGYFKERSQPKDTSKKVEVKYFNRQKKLTASQRYANVVEKLKKRDEILAQRAAELARLTGADDVANESDAEESEAGSGSGSDSE